MLITEAGEVGLVMQQEKLGLSLTTAFRELSALGSWGLLKHRRWKALSYAFE